MNIELVSLGHTLGGDAIRGLPPQRRVGIHAPAACCELASPSADSLSSLSLTVMSWPKVFQRVQDLKVLRSFRGCKTFCHKSLVPVGNPRKFQHLLVLKQEHHSEEVDRPVPPSAQVEPPAVVQHLEDGPVLRRTPEHGTADLCHEHTNKRRLREHIQPSVPPHVCSPQSWCKRSFCPTLPENQQTTAAHLSHPRCGRPRRRWARDSLRTFLPGNVRA